ncbi:Brix-domain-containing protein [Dimargaris cristalligena]|uniref:Brix-domain-containing protein n=1 Tax=Dimargaris cristalligena TaxID=215637 RepID=A0A4P9ZYV4_9FUNG|nr:Brix-domain-containing protein [Dimargaris cristalligena]|eukprot:RKP38873.1 Brix-domain-containing protein [Dimargaris cristalligena]
MEVDDQPTKPQSKVKNKQRVLMVSTRGVTQRQRHLMQDLEAMFPHFKKDNKLDSKSNPILVNELAELHNCNNAMYFEARRHTDLYMWISKTPNGPSAKFQVQNIHTMDELRLPGNCLKGSRPLLSFDQQFETKPHYQLLKQMFINIFNVPKSTRKSKPFVDHILNFSIVDNRIWFRNYQIIEKDPTSEKGTKPETSLVEIGPRFVLNPIRIFDGSYSGGPLWDNPHYVSTGLLRKVQNKDNRGGYDSIEKEEESESESDSEPKSD